MNSADKIRHTPRLYVDAALATNEAVGLPADQAHYLQHVMRMKPGDVLRIFNGRDGEWQSHIGQISKREMEVVPTARLRPQQAGPDIWLCAAPIKKAHFDYMIEKASELGVAVLQPILTERTQIREVNLERSLAVATEAAEQSDRLDIPQILEPVKLATMTAEWPKDRAMIVCAEWGEATNAAEAFASPDLKTGKAAIITGPEGGFTASELEALRKVPGVTFIRLGPRILRADTAAIAALSLWQALCGDWG